MGFKPRLIEEFINYLKTERNYSKHTISNYKRDLKFLCGFLKNRQVNRSAAREYLLALEKQHYSRRSVARKLSSARSFFRFLSREKHFDKNPFENLLTPKLPKKLPNFLYPEELNSLLRTPNLESPQGLRDLAILEIIYGTGLRVIEVVRMNTNDVDFDEREIRSLLGINKGRKSMREALGMNLETPTKEAIKKFWLLGEFLELGTGVNNKKLAKDLKKRQELLEAYRAEIGSLKKKLQNDLDEEENEKSVE